MASSASSAMTLINPLNQVGNQLSHPASVMEDVQQVSVTNQRIKPFTLNIEKTLAKKLAASKRNTCVEYTTTGGGVKGISDAVTYENGINTNY